MSTGYLWVVEWFSDSGWIAFESRGTREECRVEMRFLKKEDPLEEFRVRRYVRET